MVRLEHKLPHKFILHYLAFASGFDRSLEDVSYHCNTFCSRFFINCICIFNISSRLIPERVDRTYCMPGTCRINVTGVPQPFCQVPGDVFLHIKLVINI